MKKELMQALTRVIQVQIDNSNYGIFGNSRSSFSDIMMLNNERISFDMNTNYIYQNGNKAFKIVRRYAAKKQQGMYKQLKPELQEVIFSNIE